MVIFALQYFIPIFQVGLPLYLVLRIWRSDYKIIATWLVDTFHAMLAVICLFIIFRRDMTGYRLGTWLYGIYSVTLGISYINVYKLPFYQKGKMYWRWVQIFEIMIFIPVTIWAFFGFRPGSEAIDLEYPLKGSLYHVVQGGSTAVLNYHGAFVEQQKYALDINQLNDWGFRAGGFYPDDPGQYAVFGDTVYSPISGTVVQAVNSLPDLTPPKRMPEKPAGNHIWIKNDSLYVVLAHLKRKSILVSEGQEIQTHQKLAKVGNSGNTFEPHLHLHAVTFPNGAPQPDSLLYGGNPVPVTFDGRFLTRSSTF